MAVGEIVLVAGEAAGVADAFAEVVACTLVACFGPVTTVTLAVPVDAWVGVTSPKDTFKAATISLTTPIETSEEYVSVVSVAF